MQTQVPGNYTAPTQPCPTRPEPLDPIAVDGLTEDYVLDFTPELKREALDILSEFRLGGLYVPPLPYPHDNDYCNVIGCMGDLNIYHPAVADDMPRPKLIQLHFVRADQGEGAVEHPEERRPTPRHDR